jgi:predicted dienelactone hydrolase
MKRLILLAAVMTMATTYAQRPAPAPFELPAPTGPSPIGTARWVVSDPSRNETFAPGKREVEVIVWYPAAATSLTSAPYIRDGMEEVLSFARLAKLGDAYNGLQSVKTHATLNAAPAATPGKFPVIVFQHGYTGLPSSHTALMEDLASHGWAVLHVVHPYEATAAMMANGFVATHTNEKNALRPQITDVFNEWTAEGATMERVVAAADDAEREQLLRAYLGTLKNTNEVVKRWVLDTKYAIDHLPNAGSGVVARVVGRLDLTRLGAAGHSMGGVASGQLCVEDRRCVAGLNLDGITQYGPMIDTPMPAPFLMVYSSRPGRAGASDLIYRRSASKYYRVDVKDTLHLDFTDMNFWGGPLRERGAYGKIDPARAAEITRMVVREFFAQEILKQPSAFLSGQRPIADATVVELRKP